MVSKLDTYLRDSNDNNKKMLCEVQSIFCSPLHEGRTIESLRLAIRKGRRMPLIFLLENGGFDNYALNCIVQGGRSLLSEAIDCEIPKVGTIRVLLRYGVRPTFADLLRCEGRKMSAAINHDDPRPFRIIKAILLKHGCPLKPGDRPYQTSFMGY